MLVLQKIAREVMRPFRPRRQAKQSPARLRPARNGKPESGDPRLQSLQYCHDFSPEEVEIIRAVMPYTLTTPERIWAVINAVRHVSNLRVPGEFVECGVWRGGSTMAAALALRQLKDLQRTVYLYDTFEGMPPPSAHDRDFSGRDAAEQLREADRNTSNLWCLAGLEEVKRNVISTGYPPDRLRFVQGKVEETIPEQAPDRIALLRLDTDWYESTRHELVHLYPKLSPGGILIIDDYGYWQGARRATDEYFAALSNPPFLSRIDSTGRLAVKAA
jgi:hypothetical protein